MIVAAAVGRVFDFTHLPDYGEGTVLAAVDRMRHESLSTRWLEEPPYTLCPYGPVYYWAAAGVTRLTGLEHTLVPGRLVSLAATLATVGLLIWAVRRAAGSLAMGLLIASLFLTTPVIRGWGVVYRVDALATLMAVGAYLLAEQGGRARERFASAVSGPRAPASGTWAAWLVASAVCVAAGSLVKQTVALAALPIFLWLLVHKRRWAALGYAALVAVLGIAAWWIVDRLSGGYHVSCAVKGHMGHMSLAYGFWKGYDFLFIPLTLLGLASVLFLAVGRPWAVARSLYALGFLVSTAVATVLSGRQGSAACYFMEALSLAGLAAGAIALHALARRNAARAAWAAAFLSVLLTLPEFQALRRQGRDWSIRPYASELVESKLGARPGDWVLADGQHLDAASRAGLIPALNDSFFMRLSVEADRMDPQPLLDAMQDGRIAWLILRRSTDDHVAQINTISQKWPAEVARAMQRLYEPVASGEEIFLYRRRP